MLEKHGFLLAGRAAWGVADAGQNGGDVAVLAVERCATLGIVPGEGGEAPFDRHDRNGACGLPLRSLTPQAVM